MTLSTEIVSSREAKVFWMSELMLLIWAKQHLLAEDCRFLVNKDVEPGPVPVACISIARHCEAFLA